MPSEIHATALTTFAVDPDGGHVRLNVRDQAGQPAALVLPAQCVNQLLMSLPRMLQTALRNSHGSDSFRLVYSLEYFRLEIGEHCAERGQQYILTLATDGGFSVSFAGSEDMFAGLARSIFDDIPEFPSVQKTEPRRS